jgi:hypothetical protein
MLRNLAIFSVVVSLALCPVWAQSKGQTKFKNCAVSHFTQGEGVELSPEFAEFLYAEMRTALQKTKLFEQIIGEGEAVDPADAVQSLGISGNILEYKKGSVAKVVLIGFGMGQRSLKSHMKIVRLGDNQILLDDDLVVKTDPRLNEKVLAKNLAKKIADQVKKQIAAKMK